MFGKEKGKRKRQVNKWFKKVIQFTSYLLTLYLMRTLFLNVQY